jgi:hypothetical protein
MAKILTQQPDSPSGSFLEAAGSLKEDARQPLLPSLPTKPETILAPMSRGTLPVRI